jgi:hypothetical protein
MTYDNSPVEGCPTCKGTSGRMGCLLHADGRPWPKEKFDTTNRNMVCIQEDMIRVMYPPLRPISKAEALSLAAWLVALAADDYEKEFIPLLSAVLTV